MTSGPDADLAAVSAYRNKYDNEYYSAILDKSGQFYVFHGPMVVEVNGPLLWMKIQ